MTTALTPYNRPVARKRFTTYDLEWYPGTYKLRLVGVYDRDKGYRSYTSVEEFLDEELVPENRGRLFYAHAGGLADVQFVLEAILERRTSYEVGASFSGSAAIIFQVQERDSKTRPWVFCDSYWLMRDGLDNIGISMGTGKTKYKCPSFPLCGHFEGESDEAMCIFYAPMHILREYNANDCKMLYDAIDRLETELIDLGGELMMTIASCALRLFRRRFLKAPIPTSSRINEIASEAYVASRVEVWKRRAPTIFSYDINSSFPYSLTGKQPGRCLGVRRWDEKDELALVYAEVYVPPDIAVPPLPKRVDGRVFFPTGLWKAWFSGVDLQFLLCLGGKINRIWEAYGFDEVDDTRAYVETIYELRRKETDPFRKIVYKYLLNSLYGKFAEGSEKDVMLLRKPQPKGTRLVRSLLGGKALFLMKNVVVPHAWVPISGITTARSRRILGEGMIRIGGVHYVDTDSVNSDRRPKELGGDIETSDRLGDFKWEKDKFVSFEESDYEGLASKLYRIGSKVKAKGFSRIKGRKRLTKEDFAMLSRGEAVLIKRMTRVKEVLNEADRSMSQDEPPDFHPHDVEVLKQVALTDRPKRRWLEDGSTVPWDVGELDEPFRDEERAAIVGRFRQEAKIRHGMA